MLTEKPWRGDAVIRLGLSLMLCILMAGLADSVVQFFSGPAKPKAFLFAALSFGAFGCFVGGVFLLGRPWRGENFVSSFATLLTCVYAGFFLAWGAQRLSGSDVPETSFRQKLFAAIGFQGAALLLIHRFVRDHQLSWADGFGFKISWKRALVLGALCGVIFVPVGAGLQYASARVIQHYSGKEPNAQEAVQLLSTTKEWNGRLMLGIITIAVAPVAEELLFRGILYPFIKRRGWPRAALWGTALLFGAFHMYLPGFVPLVLLALILTWLYEKTNNLLAPIAAHSLFNSVNFAMLYLSQRNE